MIVQNDLIEIRYDLFSCIFMYKHAGLNINAFKFIDCIISGNDLFAFNFRVNYLRVYSFFFDILK